MWHEKSLDVISDLTIRKKLNKLWFSSSSQIIRKLRSQGKTAALKTVEKSEYRIIPTQAQKLLLQSATGRKT